MALSTKDGQLNSGIYVPLATGQLLRGRPETLPGLRNRLANIDAYAASAGPVHFIECRVRCLVIN